MLWIVSYDIADDKRRSKVAKLLEGYGRRAQYSVFECDIDEQKLNTLEERLKKAIDSEEDNVRFYPLNAADAARIRILGRGEVHQRQGFHIT